MRTGGIKRTVYKARGGYAALSYHAKVYARLVSDSVRVMLRLESLFRSRGVFVTGKPQLIEMIGHVVAALPEALGVLGVPGFDGDQEYVDV